MHEECGIFGIYDHPQAAKLTYLGLFALQHRGQESTGIVASDGFSLVTHRGLGLVDKVFNEEILRSLPGKLAIGHNRYSTSGSSSAANVQPLLISFFGEGIALSHNGTLINARELREDLESQGFIFQSTMDTEVIVHLLRKLSQTQEKRQALLATLGLLKGAYSLLLLTDHEVIGARDPHGFRPLVIGKLKESYLLASETCALDLLGAKYLREVKPGEMLAINEKGLKSFRIAPQAKLAQCIFEHIYFARPDSIVFGEAVHQVRERLGRRLAQEHPAEADLTICVPDSGMVASLGYAWQSRIPWGMGLTRNHYIGRTFIQPVQFARDVEVKIKLNPIKDVLQGKRVVLVDDSIVRGTTCKKIIRILREGGAKEVHFRISSPPIRYPCFFGIDTPVQKELIASSHSVEKIRRSIGANSLGYLSLEGLLSCVRRPQDYCTACFSGNYPLKVHSQREYIFEIKKTLQV